MRISDWSSDVCSSDLFDNVDIHALEARFYHFLTDQLTAHTATCYYADWNDDGSGQGLVVLEDLIARGGTFGHSHKHPGIHGVASTLAELANPPPGARTTAVTGRGGVSRLDLCGYRYSEKSNHNSLILA